MAQEFTESEVVFPDQHHAVVIRQAAPPRKEKRAASSRPVSIPEKAQRWNSGEEDAEEEEMTPPHEIVRRRVAGKMAFSVCTGNGRTLKGRDLSQVRNSILRLTGFLEA
ncbi:uncharacterized protein LOC109804416 [Cajanus cajan]|uniref:Senescence regulator S40 n=1 Tax=Cajanus cajan TaxID=3821 RepID=A0A151T772_CAJCA|nr:uncharacterized protein LOC109804416 [Cajanus cajan]KYP62900.1 hypothetical protein KK1_017460 [Cajanus cajan]